MQRPKESKASLPPRSRANLGLSKGQLNSLEGLTPSPEVWPSKKLDDYKLESSGLTREALATEVRQRLRSGGVVGGLTQLVAQQPALHFLFADNSNEFSGRLLDM